MEAFRFVLVIIIVIAGMGMLYPFYRIKKGYNQIVEKYGEEDKQGNIEQWVLAARWVPVSTQSFIVFYMSAVLHANAHPALTVVVLVGILYQLREDLVGLCESSLYQQFAEYSHFKRS